MKATQTVSPNFLDNQDQFTDPFFKRFPLKKRHAPLQLTDTISKDYNFPTFYGDVTCSQAIFLCNYEKAAELMPHPKMRPINMLGGRSLVAIASYVYRNVINVAPYNEIALTIPVMIDPTVNVPVLPMLVDKFRKFGYYVFSMPVTSEENRIRGRKIWGLPKVTHDIDIDVSGGQCKTVATDEHGNDYLKVNVATEGTPTQFDVSANLYSRLNSDLLQSATHFKANFNINKNMGLLLNSSNGNSAPAIELGNGPYADQLRELELVLTPLQTRYAKTMNACFDLNNKDYEQPFNFSGMEAQEYA
ncbi:MAG: acetoacetate decarboxylase family protein [Pseudomonadales bacterium]|nr:acetoacetate decarboxylase family protein [Pseudomonadales bacterium]